jgi:hypothetical protein
VFAGIIQLDDLAIPKWCGIAAEAVNEKRSS